MVLVKADGANLDLRRGLNIEDSPAGPSRCNGREETKKERKKQQQSPPFANGNLHLLNSDVCFFRFCSAI